MDYVMVLGSSAEDAYLHAKGNIGQKDCGF